MRLLRYPDYHHRTPGPTGWRIVDAPPEEVPMEPYYERAGIRVYHGDNREVVPALDEQFAAVVTDPPYGLSFMGKAWDHGVPGVPFWELFKAAMLPGAHLLSFGGSRTYHRVAVAIEDAGFEIRDTLQWLYGSGFPKSLDVSKAIDKAAGAERDTVGKYARPDGTDRDHTDWRINSGEWRDGSGFDPSKRDITAPATPEAERWQGWGTALKPAYEPIILARKPLAKGHTVAASVLATGTGALNIDQTRVGTSEVIERGDFDTFTESHDGFKRPNKSMYTHKPKERSGPANAAGRWPPNTILDEHAARDLDAMSGVTTSRGGNSQQIDVGSGRYNWNNGKREIKPDGIDPGYGDTGGPSRFFPVLPTDDPETLRFLYTPKASRAERNRGLDGLPKKAAGVHDDDAYVWPKNGDGSPRNKKVEPRANNHPTVKPLALMRWLLTLVTPPGGVVLDPFAGSGTTGVACAELGIPCVLIESEAEYLPIIAGRIDAALDARSGAALPLFAGVAD